MKTTRVWGSRSAKGAAAGPKRSIGRSHAALMLMLMLTMAAGAAAQAEPLPPLETIAAPEPSPARFEARTLTARSCALQFGASERTTALSAALTWDLPWRRFAHSHWEAYLEASVAGWMAQSPDPGDPERFWRVGLTPVLRYAGPHPASRWFVEAGVGVNLIGPLYRSGDRRFSSAFNFGDHLAIGWKPQPHGRQEVSLRLQHFSNAGLRSPNPGENFLQLRVAWLY